MTSCCFFFVCVCCLDWLVVFICFVQSAQVSFIFLICLLFIVFYLFVSQPRAFPSFSCTFFFPLTFFPFVLDFLYPFAVLLLFADSPHLNSSSFPPLAILFLYLPLPLPPCSASPGSLTFSFCLLSDHLQVGQIPRRSPSCPFRSLLPSLSCYCTHVAPRTLIPTSCVPSLSSQQARNSFARNT